MLNSRSLSQTHRAELDRSPSEWAHTGKQGTQQAKNKHPKTGTVTDPRRCNHSGSASGKGVCVFVAISCPSSSPSLHGLAKGKAKRDSISTKFVRTHYFPPEPQSIVFVIVYVTCWDMVINFLSSPPFPATATILRPKQHPEKRHPADRHILHA